MENEQRSGRAAKLKVNISHRYWNKSYIKHAYNLSVQIKHTALILQYTFDFSTTKYIWVCRHRLEPGFHSTLPTAGIDSAQQWCDTFPASSFLECICCIGKTKYESWLNLVVERIQTGKLFNTICILCRWKANDKRVYWQTLPCYLALMCIAAWIPRHKLY